MRPRSVHLISPRFASRMLIMVFVGCNTQEWNNFDAARESADVGPESGAVSDAGSGPDAYVRVSDAGDEDASELVDSGILCPLGFFDCDGSCRLLPSSTTVAHCSDGDTVADACAETATLCEQRCFEHPEGTQTATCRADGGIELTCVDGRLACGEQCASCAGGAHAAAFACGGPRGLRCEVTACEPGFDVSSSTPQLAARCVPRLERDVLFLDHSSDYLFKMQAVRHGNQIHMLYVRGHGMFYAVSDDDGRTFAVHERFPGGLSLDQYRLEVDPVTGSPFVLYVSSRPIEVFTRDSSGWHGEEIPGLASSGASADFGFDPDGRLVVVTQHYRQVVLSVRDNGMWTNELVVSGTLGVGWADDKVRLALGAGRVLVLSDRGDRRYRIYEKNGSAWSIHETCGDADTSSAVAFMMDPTNRWVLARGSRVIREGCAAPIELSATVQTATIEGSAILLGGSTNGRLVVHRVDGNAVGAATMTLGQGMVFGTNASLALLLTRAGTPVAFWSDKHYIARTDGAATGLLAAPSFMASTFDAALDSDHRLHVCSTGRDATTGHLDVRYLRYNLDIATNALWRTFEFSELAARTNLHSSEAPECFISADASGRVVIAFGGYLARRSPDGRWDLVDLEPTTYAEMPRGIRLIPATGAVMALGGFDIGATLRVIEGSDVRSIDFPAPYVHFGATTATGDLYVLAGIESQSLYRFRSNEWTLLSNAPLAPRRRGLGGAVYSDGHLEWWETRDAAPDQVCSWSGIEGADSTCSEFVTQSVLGIDQRDGTPTTNGTWLHMRSMSWANFVTEDRGFAQVSIVDPMAESDACVTVLDGTDWATFLCHEHPRADIFSVNSVSLVRHAL